MAIRVELTRLLGPLVRLSILGIRIPLLPYSVHGTGHWAAPSRGIEWVMTTLKYDALTGLDCWSRRGA